MASLVVTSSLRQLVCGRTQTRYLSLFPAACRFFCRSARAKTACQLREGVYHFGQRGLRILAGGYPQGGIECRAIKQTGGGLHVDGLHYAITQHFAYRFPRGL